jgi:GNAT superfamily N-acetyltransferase
MPEPPLESPMPLDKTHLTADFHCGADELDDWLHRYAWVNHCSGNARVFVTARARRVVGYYALATAGVERREAPEQLVKGGVPTQVPCLLLARLAVDLKEQNRKLGRALLVDAIRRAVRVSNDIGIRALLIHARDEKARSFYEHQGEFLQSPSDPLHLFLPLKYARSLIEPGL